jgi:hypothetical protein
MGLHQKIRTDYEVEYGPRERRAPIRQAIAWARVREFDPRTASSDLDSSLKARRSLRE